MTLETLLVFLGWTALINLGILAWWCLCVCCMRDLVFRFHQRLFKISDEQFNAIHYAGIVGYKMLILFFNIIPYLVLRLCIA